IEELQSRAIDAEFQLLTFAVASEKFPGIPTHRRPVKYVFAVCWKVIFDEHSAACAKGQPLNMCFLGEILRSDKILFSRRQLVTECEPADFCGSRHICFQESRRNS